MIRNGLRESLEEYARRLGVKVAHARLAWRLEGLRLLGVEHARAAAPGLCVVAFVPVPTNNGPTIIEEEHDPNGHQEE
jgi:hypothetical protein